MNVYRNPYYRSAGIILVLIGVVLAVADRSILAGFPDRESAWRIAVFLATAALGVGMFLIRVVATAETLTIRNLLRTHVLPWDAIAGFDLEASLVVELKDGRRIGCSAVQPTGLDRMTGRKGYAGTTAELLDARRRMSASPESRSL
ncbi:PH domain-containing protein [Kitasatospora sp. NPDC057223]|uniref:PH domain-containing protein n=1 Tax=Kitasatospora sp. NPDC057223 TaxID=3346055 RepID=UPI003626A27C